ncbi:glycosyltransferase [Psychrobacter glacincola]
MSIAIVVHAYYVYQLKYIIEKIKDVLESSNDFVIDVHITIPKDRFEQLKGVLEKKLPCAKMYIVDNCGLDIVPLAEMIDCLYDYEWVLKLHTKNDNSANNDTWFRTSVDALIGTKKIFFDTIELIKTHSDLVMIGAMPYYVSAVRLMLGNRKNVGFLAQEWGLNLEEDWGFFAGSFYWFKPSVFRPYLQTIVQNKSWFHGEYRQDGLMAHAVERLITLVGLKYGDIGLLLSDRSEFEYYSSSHSLAVNKLTMQDLLGQYQTLDEDIKLLESGGIIDIEGYKQQAAINFKEDRSVLLHFLLIGQFNGLSKYSYPFYLRQVNKNNVCWQKGVKVSRISDRVSIIIPIYNNLSLTLKCLSSILKNTAGDYEIILVNNGSSYFISKVLMAYSYIYNQIKVVKLGSNLNFSIGCNIGASRSLGEHLVFLNNDTVVTKNWLSPLISALSQDQVIAVQPKLLYPDNNIQSAGVIFGEDGFGKNRLEGEASNTPDANISTDCPAITGACLAICAHNFIEAEGFDAIFINGQEDIDLCMRLKVLYPESMFWYCADSQVYHVTSQTEGRGKYIAQNRMLFAKRWFK